LNICKLLEIPNTLTKDKVHTTLIYSTKHVEGVEVNAEEVYNAFISKLDIFTSSTGNKCLVAILECGKMVSRHKELMKKYGFTYDYPEYIPHVTLSYDIKDWDRFDLMNQYIKDSKFIYQLQGAGEYYEDLDLDWAETTKE
jgi:2'-5' RNA ligase